MYTWVLLKFCHWCAFLTKTRYFVQQDFTTTKARGFQCLVCSPGSQQACVLFRTECCCCYILPCYFASNFTSFLLGLVLLLFSFQNRLCIVSKCFPLTYWPLICIYSKSYLCITIQVIHQISIYWPNIVQMCESTYRKYSRPSLFHH